MSPRTLCLSSLLLTFGCVAQTTTTGASGDAEQPEDAASSEADAQTAEPTTKPDAPERAALPTAELPPCPADVADAYCTADAKLAGEWVLVDRLRVPDDAEVIFEAPHPDRDRQPSLSVLAQGDRLFVRQVTCGACARVLGQGFSGLPAMMDAEQLAAMQARMGLPDSVGPLQTIKDWRRYCQSQAGTLDELSLKTEL